MMMMTLILIYLVPTISRERAKTIMKIPWAPIPVTSLCDDDNHGDDNDDGADNYEDNTDDDKYLRNAYEKNSGMKAPTTPAVEERIAESINVFFRPDDEEDDDGDDFF